MASRSQQVRRRQLRVTKRRATFLLAVVTVVFLATTLWGNASSWVGYVQATAAASMVGGLADWFAVSALFRHPLGLPIPHTAIVVERKDQFATTLGEFIQESFLTPELILARVRAADPVARMAEWLSDRENASRAAAEVADAVVAVSGFLGRDDARQTVESWIRQGLEAVPLSPVAGKVLRSLTGDGRADEVIDRVLHQTARFLDEHRDELRRQLTKRSRWWLPGPVDSRLFDRVIDGARSVAEEMAGDRSHPLRQQLMTRIGQLVDDLETDPVMQEQAEKLVHRFLAQPDIERWAAALWDHLDDQLNRQSRDPQSTLRQRLTDVVVGLGRRLQEDPALASRVDNALESLVCYVAEHFNQSIAGIVTGTVARWDAHETASRLELLLGPDLQWVRINGTVVGAGAGLLLQVVARALR
jgi:uncharacterized membrane-anchored protein YjiN (DUF445 family)